MLRRTLTLTLSALLATGAALAPRAAAALEIDQFGCDWAMNSSVNLSYSDAFAKDTVVLTTTEAFADGLAAVPLAAALKAPVLVTYPDKVDPYILASIRDRGVKRAIIVGGPQALPRTAERDLAAAGASVERLYGKGRAETALAVADKVRSVTGGSSTPVYLATGMAFPDALSSGAAAARDGGVVLLSLGRRLDPATAAYLRSGRTTRVLAVGGGAVAAAAGAGQAATALAGADRFDTAARVAAATFPTGDRAVVVDGLTFGHAIAGSAYAAAVGGPLLLTAPTRLPDATRGYLSGTHPKVFVFGGPSRVGQAVLTALTLIPQNGPAPDQPTPTPSTTPTPGDGPDRPLPTPQDNPSPTTEQAQDAEAVIVASTTAQRASAGLPPLTLNPCLSGAARDWSRTMTTGEFRHSPSTRGAACGRPATGENIAKGYRTAADAMTGWMNSPGHRQNILGRDYVEIGVGVARAADGTPYYTQIFSLAPRPGRAVGERAPR